MEQNSQNIVPEKFNINNSYFKKKSFDALFDKQYYVIINKKLYIINIKGLHEKIFIYVYDVFKSDRKLVHIFDVNKNIKFIEKYVQISHDLNLLSIPDDDYLYIYNVNDLINHGVLNIFNGGITLNIKHTIPTIVDSKTTINSKLIVDNVDKQTWKPYKCILYDNKYVIIFSNGARINAIVIYDFTKNDAKILDIDDDIVESHIFFSENGLYLMKYVGGKLCIANIETEKTKIIVLSNQLCKTIIPSTFAISDNGELITVLNNNDVIMINDNSQIDKCNIDEQFGNLKDITLNIIDSSDNKNKINVITLWNKKLHKILLITLICNNGHILTKKYLNFKINDELDIVYTNGHEYVYKFDEYIDVYSIDKIISLNNLDSLLDILLINLDKFGTQNVQLLIIGPKRQNICNVKKWLVNMAGGLQQVDLSKHSELVDIVVLKNKKGTDMNLVQIFLALMHNHKLINDYLNCIASDGLYEDKIESIILSFLKFAKILISLCKNDTIINLFEYYIDYLLIKIATVVYVHETDIELIINIFKNIKNTKEFMVSMFKINFELDLMSYG